MPTDPKHFRTPPFGPLTSEDRKVIASHERLHLEASQRVFDSTSERLRERALAAIALFEKGESDSPCPPEAGSGPTPHSRWIGLAVDCAIRGEPIPPRPAPKRYFVHWGHMRRHIEEFTDFQRAIDYFVDHKGAADGARLVGEGYDADCDEDGLHEVSDGLTDEERERVEAVS